MHCFYVYSSKILPPDSLSHHPCLHRSAWWKLPCLVEIMSLQLCRVELILPHILSWAFSPPLDIKIKAALHPYFTCPHTVVEVAALMISELHLGFFSCLKG